MCLCGVSEAEATESADVESVKSLVDAGNTNTEKAHDWVIFTVEDH